MVGVACECTGSCVLSLSFLWDARVVHAHACMRAWCELVLFLVQCAGYVCISQHVLELQFSPLEIVLRFALVFQIIQ